jgi:hypothetical protein
MTADSEKVEPLDTERQESVADENPDAFNISDEIM